MVIPKGIFEAFLAGACIGIGLTIICMMFFAVATGFAG